MANRHDGCGGRREGAGRKASWKSGPCKAVKLPITLIADVLRYARQLDAGEIEGALRTDVIPLAEHQSTTRDAGTTETPRGDRWAQVSKLLDEKAELQRRLEHQAELLAGTRRKLQMEESRNHELDRRIADARSVLRAAYDEQCRGVRKGIRVADVQSALLALGLDVAPSPPD